MESIALKQCFGNSFSIIENLFNSYSPENNIELSFNDIPDNIFKNGTYETEYFGKVLTTFAAFKFKIDYDGINNEFQTEGEREMIITKVQYQNGFVKYSNLTPIHEKIDIEKERLRLDEARLQHEQQLALNELEVNKLEIQSRNKQTRLTFIGSLIGSCVTLGGIAMILNKEEVSCITSKALGFVPKIPFFNKK